MDMWPIVAGMLFVAGIPFAICLGLGLSGKRRAAWRLAGVIAVLAVAAPVLLSLGDLHGQAGLGIILFAITVLLPGVAGALLGAGLGHLVTWGASRRS